MESLRFLLTKSFRPRYGPGVGSDSSKDEYQDHTLVAKGDRCQGLRNFPLLYADFLEILEPHYPGKLRAFSYLYRD